MNKNDRKLLSKGESLYFKVGSGGYRVSAENVSVEIVEENKKESIDSKKILGEKKVSKVKDLAKKDSKEKVLDEELKETAVLEEVPKESVKKDSKEYLDEERLNEECFDDDVLEELNEESEEELEEEFSNEFPEEEEPFNDLPEEIIPFEDPFEEPDTISKVDLVDSIEGDSKESYDTLKKDRDKLLEAVIDAEHALDLEDSVEKDSKKPDDISEDDLKDSKKPDDISEDDLVDSVEEDFKEPDDISEDYLKNSLEEDVIVLPPDLEKDFTEEIPKEFDSCPGVSSKERYPILRNNFFMILLILVLIIVGLIIWGFGTNSGVNKSFLNVSSESIEAETITAGRVMSVEAVYYTGVDENWMITSDYEFSFKEDSPILWIYRRAGVLYYDVECLNRVPFPLENGGKIRNANSTLGTVTLSFNEDSWIVDNTGEVIVFFSGYNYGLESTMGGFTETAEKTFKNQPLAKSLSGNKKVFIPVTTEAILNYNSGSGWKSIKVSDWDGDTSSFELWNFAPNSSSMRYWDSELKDQVPLDNPGNYFWGQDGKKCWDGLNVVDLI
jgi:hypothetical protein